MTRFPSLERRIPVLLAGVLMLAVGGIVVERLGREDAAEAQPPPASPVPVKLAKATVENVPLFLDGLGTVQAYNTVAVRTRVDGQIEQVAFHEGQLVRAGDLLVQIDPRPYRSALDQAKAKRAEDEALLQNSKTNLQRYTELGAFATRQQVDTQTSLVAQQQAQVAADAAAIDNAQTQLDYTTIRSPITGIVGFRQVDIGNIVNAATQGAIVSITQIEPIFVMFTAPEERVTDIAAALGRGTVVVEAYSTDGRRKLSEGRLEVMNNTVDTATGTIGLKATFENGDHALWPGLSVSARTRLGTETGVVTVPDEAIQHGPNGLFVFTVDATKRAKVRQVKVGRNEDGMSVVTDGLAAGETVIVSGQSRVDDGTLVEGAGNGGAHLSAGGR